MSIDTKELRQQYEAAIYDADPCLWIKIPALLDEIDKLRERLQQSPYGDDKIDELEEAVGNLRFQLEQKEAENAKLREVGDALDGVTEPSETVLDFLSDREELKKWIGRMAWHCKRVDALNTECADKERYTIELYNRARGAEGSLRVADKQLKEARQLLSMVARHLSSSGRGYSHAYEVKMLIGTEEVQLLRRIIGEEISL